MNTVIPYTHEKRTSGHWSVLRRVVPWVASLALLGGLAWSQDWAAVGEAFSRANLVLFVGVLAVWAGLNLVVEAFFLHLSFKWLAGVDAWRAMVRVKAASYLLTIVSVVVGYGGLVVYAKKAWGVPWRRGVGLMIHEAFEDVGSMGLLALVLGMGMQGSAWLPEAARGQMTGVIGFGVGCVAFYLVCILISRLTAWWGFPKTVLSIFEEIRLSQYAFFLGVKTLQNVMLGVWVALALRCFGVHPPALFSVASAQVIHLVHSLPVAAFGVGVDQLTIPTLFQPWEGSNDAGALFAFSVAFTFSLVAGRAVLGLPFVRGVWMDLSTSSTESSNPLTHPGGSP